MKIAQFGLKNNTTAFCSKKKKLFKEQGNVGSSHYDILETENGNYIIRFREKGLLGRMKSVLGVNVAQDIIYKKDLTHGPSAQALIKDSLIQLKAAHSFIMAKL